MVLMHLMHMWIDWIGGFKIIFAMREISYRDWLELTLSYNIGSFYYYLTKSICAFVLIFLLTLKIFAFGRKIGGFGFPLLFCSFRVMRFYWCCLLPSVSFYWYCLRWLWMLHWSLPARLEPSFYSLFSSMSRPFSFFTFVGPFFIRSV